MLRVTHLRTSKYFPLHIYCQEKEWNKKECRLERSYPEHKKDNDLLRTYEQRASDALRYFERELVQFSFSEFEAIVFSNRAKQAKTVWQYIQEIAENLATSGSFGNSKTYDFLFKVIKGFDKSATLRNIDSAWLSRFEKHLRTARNMKDGGVSIIMRGLRASCNRATKENLMPKGWNPFSEFTLTHLKKTKAQRAISLDHVKAFSRVDIMDASEHLARDIFMFSFYTRGMNFADIIELTPASIRDMRIEYTRKKTCKKYSIKISTQAAEILDRYKGGHYLFPILMPDVHKTEQQIFDRKKKYEKKINKLLKELARRAGIDPLDFTIYVARHSYAMAHKTKGTPMNVIQELMGHSDGRTTEHYLNAFSSDTLDRADENII